MAKTSDDVTNPDGLERPIGRRLRSGSQDLLAGVIGLSFALGAGYLVADLPMKQGVRMSAGYFPKILTVIVGGLSLVLLAKGLARRGQGIALDAARPFVFVSLSVLAFALLIERAGLVVAAAALVLTACLAERAYPLRTALLLAAGLTGASILLFVKGLRVPMAIAPW